MEFQGHPANKWKKMAAVPGPAGPFFLPRVPETYSGDAQGLDAAALIAF